MKTSMGLVQDACLEVSANSYHEPYEEMKLAALSLAERLLACEAALAVANANVRWMRNAHDDDADDIREKVAR